MGRESAVADGTEKDSTAESAKNAEKPYPGGAIRPDGGPTRTGQRVFQRAHNGKGQSERCAAEKHVVRWGR